MGERGARCFGVTNLNETAVEESEADDVVRNHDSVSVGVDEGLFKKSAGCQGKRSRANGARDERVRGKKSSS